MCKMCADMAKPLKHDVCRHIQQIVYSQIVCMSLLNFLTFVLETNINANRIIGDFLLYMTLLCISKQNDMSSTLRNRDHPGNTY